MKQLTFKRIQIGFVFRIIRSQKNKGLKKENQEGKIYMRILENLNTPAEIFTGVKCLRSNWQGDRARVLGRDELAKSNNNTLRTLEVAVRNIHTELVSKNEKVNPKIIKDILTGETEKKNDLLECFARRIERDKNEHAKTTQKHYRTTQKYLKSFIQNIYKKDTFPLTHVDIEFIETFNSWLFSNTNCHKNGASKHHFRLQRFLDLELRRKAIYHNPYSEYKISKQKSNITFLEREEIDKLINAELDSSNNHELVRDGFLFSIYTGLSYSDLERITRDKIFKNKAGKPVLRESRFKNGNPFAVPIIEEAQEILDKYADHPIVINSNELIPSISNQKFNKNLKAICSANGIKKNVHHHMARHTFATIIMLEEKSMPIEKVKKMMGHTKISMTEKYAKIRENFD